MKNLCTVHCQHTSNPSEEDMAISFGSMSIGTRPSTNWNKSNDGYGYVMSDYSGTSYGAQDDKKDYEPTSWLILTISYMRGQ